MKKQYTYLFVLLGLLSVKAQEISLNEIEENFGAHVYFLADDKLEGRATGSIGEKMAQNYIIDRFIEYGILPKAENNSYLQKFDFVLGKSLSENNSLSINGQALSIEKEFFPLIYSGNGVVNGQIANLGFGIDADSLYNDYEDKTNLEGKVFLIRMSSPDGIHPHSKYKDFSDYKSKITTAKNHGAAAILFYNDDPYLNDPSANLKRKVTQEDIPVLFVQKNMISLLKENMPVNLSVQLKTDKREGSNVIGYIDNHAEKTIVIGAHYDHLGWGKDGGSLYKGKAQIHNGADDNASGVAMLLELAHILKKQENSNNNYLFICFSAEELGLIGSKSFLLSPTIDISTINYMINLDMVGRLDEEDRKIAISGAGTSPLFEETLKNIKAGDLELSIKSSGMGPSDHASFYLKNIPVLFFFTGTHKDYHKPSDDAWKINYKGMTLVFSYITKLFSVLDSKPKLSFTKTKEETTSGKRRFSVTLGVIPDYMFEGKGMRIDGVSENKPAAVAGLITGDVVIQLGETKVSDMMSYMAALGKFKKGDKTFVNIVRNNEVKRFNIRF